MPNPELPILLVDNDESSYRTTRDLLREINGRAVRLERASDYASGKAAILRGAHEVYLVNDRHGADGAVDLLSDVRRQGCLAPIIVLTDTSDESFDQRVLEAGATDWVTREAGNLARLGRAIRQALERQSLIQELDQERSLLHSLMQHLPDHIYFKDRDSRFLRISRAMADWFGLDDPVQANGLTDADFFADEHAEQARRDELELMNSGRAVVGKEEKETWPDGRTTWVSTSKLTLRDESGEVIGTFGISRDITQEKEALQALRQSERTGRMIINTALDAFIGMNTGGVIVNWNPQAEETFGWPAEEALGATLSELIIPERLRKAHEAGLRRFLDTRSGDVLGQRLELSALHRDGHEFPIEITISAIVEDQETLFAAFVHDITRRKESERALRESRDAAEAASQAKSDFLANMSHEIRTPMNAIIGMTELVLDTELSRAQREYLELVRDSGDSLLNLINDILDFSRIEAGKLELESIVFSLREVVGDTLKSLAVRARKEELELIGHIEPDVPDVLTGDPARLRQVIVNLVGNAIKFTEQGEVVLHVEVDDLSGDSLRLHFVITDTGIGIAPDKLKTIFSAFEQADTSMTRRFGGTGLGLTICARLVRLMQGSIWVNSEPGSGSAFHFTAQLRVSDQPPPEQGRRLVQGTRVLVVDDNATNRRILEEMLSNWELRVVAVTGVTEAEAALDRALDEGDPFQLVLSDVNMPDRDGFELAEAVTSDARHDEAVILMLTSGDRLGDVQRCQEMGVAAHLRKPIKQSELFDAIVAALDINATEPAVPENESPGPEVRSGPQLRVLLVEDSVVNQKLAIGLLRQWGHSVQIAGTGRQALDLFESSPFDLILMDVQMPEMDGLEATRRIRETESDSGSHIPIIAMTAHALQGDREKCLDAGMDSYLTKPVRSRQLAEEIERLIDAEALTVRNSADDAPSDDRPASETSSVEWTHLMKTVRGDRELLRDIASAFLFEVKQAIPDLKSAIKDEDAKEAQRLSHLVKGSFRTFGATEAHDLAYVCEQAAQDGDLDSVRERLPQLKEHAKRVADELSQFLDTGQIPP